jgi:tyrosine-protein kinase Etk/Wzc
MMVNSEYQEDIRPIGNFQVRELVLKYLRYWPVFLIVMVVSILCAFAFLYVTIPRYEAYTTVLVKDEVKNSGFNETGFFEDLGILVGRGNLDNEIELLKSRSLMRNVVDNLSLNISIFEEKNPLDIELYHNSPFLVLPSGEDSLLSLMDTVINVKIVSLYKYQVFSKSGTKDYKFGEPFSMKFGRIRVLPNFGYINNYVGKKLRIHFKPSEEVAGIYLGRLKVDPVNNKANVIKISLRDPVKEKAIDILNSLVLQNKQNEINNNNQAAINTSKFIQDRIEFLNNELFNVENTVQAYKSGNNLVNLGAESELFLTKATEAERSLSESFIQLKISEYLLEHLEKSNGPDQLIPSNLGLAQVAIATQIDGHNKLAMDRSRLMLASGKENPRIINLNNQIGAYRESIREALRNEVKSLEFNYKEINNRVESLQAKISSVPRKEREFRELERQRQIKETLYLYLLQKREESSIALAVPVTNTDVIDAAFSNGLIISPNKKFVLAFAFILGLLIPISGIYLISLFNTKIRTAQEIEFLKIPIIGEIPFVDTEEKLIFRNSDDRAALEAFRSLRTNLSFILDSNDDTCKTIAITSSIAKEGKTFISINLAAALAYTGKKVLICGVDLRTPKLLNYLGMIENKGLSNYLKNEVSVIEDVIFPVLGIEHLHVLSSGDIPPNPSELLMKNRSTELFNDLKKKFDYIVIDTAPVGLVADALLLSEYTDVLIYLIRSRFTDKRLLSIPEDLYKDKRFKNLALLLNEAELRTEYGYTYGYYGDKRKKSFYKRFLRPRFD